MALCSFMPASLLLHLFNVSQGEFPDMVERMQYITLPPKDH